MDTITNEEGTAVAGHNNWNELRGQVVERIGEDGLAKGVDQARLEALVADVGPLLLLAIGAMALADLRKKKGRSQTDMAAQLGVTQPEVSRVEHEPDPRLSTVRSYVEGLGGRLHILAEVDGELVPIELPDAA